MKIKLPFVAACFALASLTACGGGGAAADQAAALVYSGNPANLVKTDTTLGTGADATTGKRLTVNYTGWLYNQNAADLKGTKFDAGTFSFTLGAGAVIAGFDQGVLGMKVGGKRTLLIPSSLGYGANGAPPSIPGNAGLVFEIELVGVQ